MRTTSLKTIMMALCGPKFDTLGSYKRTFGSNSQTNKSYKKPINK